MDRNLYQNSGIYTFGNGDRVYVNSNGKVTLLKLRDGGQVFFIDLNDPNQTYWAMSYMTDPHGLTYTRSVTTNAQGAVVERMTDASGRWVQLTYGSNNNGSWPVRADSSNGDYVNYTWDLTPPAGLQFPINYWKLIEADYADGTSATYQYVGNSRGVFPFRCFDVRAPTHMHSVEYSFNQNLNDWGMVSQHQCLALYPIVEERLPYSSSPLSSRSEVAAGYVNGRGAVETRGDGATRLIVPDSAYNGSDGQIYSETDYLGNRTLATHGVSETFTDPLGHTTHFDYVPSSGSFGWNKAIENPTKITMPTVLTSRSAILICRIPTSFRSGPTNWAG